MSSKKANTVFQVKPRRTKFITLAYVPGALHNSKLILMHSKCQNFVVNTVFSYLLVLFLPVNMHYWHQALSTRCFRPKYLDINPKLILTHSKSPNFVVNAVFLLSSGCIPTCQYALLASSFEYQMFPAKVSRHSSINER